jgi:hypothetical protein
MAFVKRKNPQSKSVSSSGNGIIHCKIQAYTGLLETPEVGSGAMDE